MRYFAVLFHTATRINLQFRCLLLYNWWIHGCYKAVRAHLSIFCPKPSNKQALVPAFVQHLLNGIISPYILLAVAPITRCCSIGEHGSNNTQMRRAAQGRHD